MTESEGGGTDGKVLAVALQVLGASAGVSALAAFVGGATMWIRFDALQLPADQAVAQLPERLLLIVGVHAIAASVAIAAVVAIGLSFIPQSEGKPTPRFWKWLIAVTIGGVVAAVLAVWGVEDVVQLLVVFGIGVLGVLAIAGGACAANLARRHVALIVFAVFSICGASIAIVRTLAHPALEPAAVLLKDGKPGLAGFYVGQSGDRLYLSPLPGDGSPDDPFADAPIESMVEIPRGEVLRIATRKPTSLRNDGGGRDQAQTLLADLKAQQVAPERRRATPPVETSHPEIAFAPLAHLHSKEELWPMSAEDYIDNSVLVWAHNRRCDWSFAAREHVKRDERRLLSAKRRVGAIGGASQYAHPAAGAGCSDRGGESHSATQITRPYEKTGRPDGLPLTEGFYLNVDNEFREGTPRSDKEGSQRFVETERIPVYWERHKDARNSSRERITYWFFYGLSRPPGPKGILRHFVHEGDWERISVLLDPRPATRSFVPISVRYHFHEENRDVPWYAVRRVAASQDGEPTHPVVYIARESHASYPRAGRSEEEREIVGGKKVRASDDAIACPDCPRWRTWENLLPAGDADWYGFGGAWGNIGADGGRTGPLGPSPRKTCGRRRCL